MSDDQEVMLQIGFQPHPNAQAQLEALGKAAIDVQKKIDDAGQRGVGGGLSKQSAIAKETTKAISDVGDAVDKVITTKKRDTETFVSGEKEKQQAIKETTKAESGLEKLRERLRQSRERVNRLQTQQASPSRTPQTPPSQGPSFADLFGASTMEGAQLLGFVDKVEKQIGKGSKAFEQFEATGSKSLRSLNKELENLRKLSMQGPEQLQQAFETGRIERAIVATAKLGNEVTKQNVSFRKLTRNYETASVQAAAYRKQAQTAFASASQGATQVAIGVGQLSQGFVLLNGILEDHKTRVVGAADSTRRLDLDTVDLLAKIQGGIQIFSGAEKAIGGFVRTVDGLSGYVRASALAKTALSRATQAEIQLSRFRMAQMTTETAAVQAQTAAVLELAAARGLAANAGLSGGRAAASGVAQGAAGAGGQLAAGAAGGIAAKGLGTGGLVAGASVGAIVTAAVAAVGGAGFYLKSLFETAKEVDRAGFGQGAEVGGFTDTIASAEVAVVDWIGTVSGAFDLLGTVARKEAEKRQLAAERRLAIENRLSQIQLDGASQRARAERDYSSNLLDLSLSIANSTQNRLSLFRSSIGDAQVALSANRIDQAQAESDGNESRAAFLRNQEKQLLQDLLQLRQRERTEAEAGARERRQSLLDEVTATEQILRNRLSESDALRAQLRDAGQRFVDLTKKDQRLAERAFEDARAGNLLSTDERRRLAQIGTRESQALLDDQYDRALRATRFGERFGRTDRELIDEANRQAEEARRKINEQLRDSGQAELGSLDQLRASIKLDPTIEFVDRTTFEIDTEKATREVSETIIEEMQKLYGELREAIREEIQVQENARVKDFNDSLKRAAQRDSAS